MLIVEDFLQPDWDRRLRWLNPPPYASSGGSLLEVRPAAQTDFWQRTHYGFRADTGHLLALDVEGDFRCETELTFRPAHQYDQAGLMVRLSPDCWLKTSVEYEPEGLCRLGAVVTNGGYSDWSTQDFDPGLRMVAFRVDREGSDYMVFYRAPPAADWTQIRVAHLMEDQGGPVQVGLYACSPKGAGFEVRFDYIRIDGRG